MRYYLIDGNNVIGKIPELKQLQKQDPQAVRQKITMKLSEFFRGRRDVITLFFDGFEAEPLARGFIKVRYSNSRTADELIRDDISESSNRSHLKVVSSDRGIIDFARACSCEVITADEFASQLSAASEKAEEEEIINAMKNNIDEFKKLYGADD